MLSGMATRGTCSLMPCPHGRWCTATLGSGARTVPSNTCITCYVGKGASPQAGTAGELYSMACSLPSLVRMYRRPLANTGAVYIDAPQASFQTSSP
jgi:hypothetical protein